MAQVNRRSSPISDKDLKQTILKKNKSLEFKNKALKSSIKDQEKELKSLEKDCSSKSKEYGKLIKDVGFQEDKFQKVVGGVYSNEKLLSVKLKKVSSAEKEYLSYEEGVTKLREEKDNLKSDIEKLEFYKGRCEESKVELASYQVKKDKALDKIDSIESDIDQLRINHNTKIITCEAEYNKLEEKAKKHEDMIYQFEQRLITAQDMALDEEKKLKAAEGKFKKEKEKMDEELQAVKNLTDNTEDKYIEWEVKLDKIKQKADKEEERITKAKERFAKWRVGALEEVARMKLKGKIENIDKAGLSEILNG